MLKVELENIFKVYKEIDKDTGKTKHNTVIDNLDMAINDGEFITLVGESGCGKSTLLRLIAGLDEPTSGNIYIDGKLSNNLSPKNRDIGMVFQSYALFPHMSVEANIGFGLKIKRVADKERKKKISEILSGLRLEKEAVKMPSMISGGQRQRVAVGRAMATEPGILLMDEPLSNLDARLRSNMRTEFKHIHKKQRNTIIYVTHDQVEAMTLGDRMAIMNKGIIEQFGTPDEIYFHPANIFVAGFIGEPQMNFISGEIMNEKGSICFSSADLKLGLSDLPEKNIAQFNNFNKKKVILGIRPQDVYMHNHRKVSLFRQNQFKIKIDIILPLGPRKIIVSKLDTSDKTDINFHIELNNDIICKEDDLVEFGMDLNHVHFFDFENKKAIF